MTNERTPLDVEIRARIARRGPIPLAEFMALSLYDPQHGYYSRRAPFGAAGDFITAPEISQMFGELIGLWAA
jgi:NADH dehydrogenase [ubiquinone] 1 alpha subcomplex assembly factor 7